MSFEREVTARVVSASLTANGELRRDVLSDAVARAALLVDLALDGRLPQSMLIDMTATGFDPIDRLLLAVEADPARSLSWWLSHAPVRAADVAQDLVGRGAWMVTQRSLGRAARYRPPEFAYGRMEMTEQLTAALHGRPVSRTWTAAACLIGAVGYLPDYADYPEQRVIERCDSAAWLVDDLVTELWRKRATLAAGTRAVNADMGWGTPGAS